tara:strand:+ start:265 stop:537 length:273 start_codon:yes stop_codon:yes gene_type:complete
MPEGKGTYGSVKGRPPKKKKLKKVSLKKPVVAGLSAGQIVQATMLAKGKNKKSDAGKLLVAGVATDLTLRALKKAWNKYADKVNKKRGHK